jgi:hypothetical protein
MEGAALLNGGFRLVVLNTPNSYEPDFAISIIFGGVERVELPGLHRWLGARWSAV